MMDELRVRLRTVLDRPIPDDQRRRIGVIALTIIVAGAAVAVTASPDGSPRPHDTRTATERPPTPTQPAPREPVENPAALPVPSEEQPANQDERTSERDVREAKRAARAFLAGYLAYSYGRGDPRSIANATNELRDKLAANPPRVPVVERRRRARVTVLQASGVSARRMGMIALVDDGLRSYSIQVELAHDGERWLATNVGA